MGKVRVPGKCFLVPGRDREEYPPVINHKDAKRYRRGTGNLFLLKHLNRDREWATPWFW